jgi:hypothetical protein
LNKVLYDFMCGVGMYFEFSGQCADRGERLARLKLAADESLLCRENDLIEDGLARGNANPNSVTSAL